MEWEDERRDWGDAVSEDEEEDANTAGWVSHTRVSYTKSQSEVFLFQEV